MEEKTEDEEEEEKGYCVDGWDSALPGLQHLL